MPDRKTLDIRTRKPLRLRGYDYSQQGAYFVTLCVKNHQCLFARVSDSEMRMNDAGAMVELAWQGLTGRFPGIELDAYTIMPNHFHGIICITQCDKPVGGRPLWPPTIRAMTPRLGRPRGSPLHWVLSLQAPGTGRAQIYSYSLRPVPTKGRSTTCLPGVTDCEAGSPPKPAW
ncbi:MAG: hypothetical protein PHQ23_07520 [Candidatus Wallbacteria bacterium]|nr:hypothetical protein [Candidatus Wallbacteria bacterium]